MQKTALEVPTPFASFDDYWEPFLRERLPAAADGSIMLEARA